MSEENKRLYIDWFIMYLNRKSMDTRLKLLPTAAYVCEEVHFDHIFEKDGERYAYSVKMELWEVAANGVKHLVIVYKGDSENLKINQKSTSEPYLRVEVKEGNNKVWYHVLSLSNWY